MVIINSNNCALENRVAVFDDAPNCAAFGAEGKCGVVLSLGE